jgi:surface antigen
MRVAVPLTLVLLLAGCVVGPPPPLGQYDPTLYDAGGNAIPPVAQAAPPAAPEPTCHEVQTTVIIAGKPQAATGTACLGPDGHWHFTN